VFTDILLDALDKLHLDDAISLSSTLDDRNLSEYENIMVVDQLHQDEIFPQCDVIAHHGGAGSASQCIRSGQPGLCIPSMPFQHIWCGQLQHYAAGVTLDPKQMVAMWEKNGTNVLIDAIERSMKPNVQKAARELCKTIENAGGVELAADTDHRVYGRAAKKKSVPRSGYSQWLGTVIMCREPLWNLTVVM